jgi:hypothetical protein
MHASGQKLVRRMVEASIRHRRDGAGAELHALFDLSRQGLTALTGALQISFPVPPPL